MNNLLKEGKLLDEDGELLEAGYATSLVKEYSRDDIKGNKTRIKEWDYYAILNDDFALTLTIDDNSYMSLISASFLDFKNKKYNTKSLIRWLSFGSVGLPSSSLAGDTLYKYKDYDLRFLSQGNQKELVVNYPNFRDGKALKCDIILEKMIPNSLVIVTPFKKPGHFYYNQKINCLKANGTFTIGDEKYSLNDSLGVLDWGRGVWTYKNTWYWASMSTKDEEGYKGFNLGYGFGDTSKASENMVFKNNKAYKLDDVEFLIPKNGDTYDYMKEWKILSKSKNINLTFTPILDRHDDTNALLIASFQHQVFGYYNGTFTVENGEVITIKNAIGFAERVTNKW